MENLFLRNGPPLKVVTDNGCNFTSRRFQSLMQKYGVEHARCSPHHHSGNGSAEKSVDTLKRMMLKVPKANIAEASWKLNNMVRPGMETTPMNCFLGRRMRSHLPNDFNRECKIVETLYKRIQNQFNIAQNGLTITMIPLVLETASGSRILRQGNGTSWVLSQMRLPHQMARHVHTK